MNSYERLMKRLRGEEAHKALNRKRLRPDDGRTEYGAFTRLGVG